jgi:hypothetical protein
MVKMDAKNGFAFCAFFHAKFKSFTQFLNKNCILAQIQEQRKKIPK